MVLLCGWEVMAEPPRYLFSKYSSLDGLTHDRISDIYTDSHGYVWLCTWYGVSRFDGYAFKNYGTDPDVSYPFALNRFVSVSEDSCSHLWFKTYDTRIFRLNRYTEQFEDVMSIVDGVDEAHYRTEQIVHDLSGGTWVAVPQYGLVWFKATADSEALSARALFTTESLGGEISTLYVDSSDRVWVATREGQISIIDNGTLRIISRTYDCFEEVVEMNSRLFFMAKDVIVRVGSKNFNIVRIPSLGAHFTSIEADRDRGLVYVGGSRGELFRINGGSKSLEAIAVGRGGDLRIRDIVADSHGALWITTAEQGITRYDPLSSRFRRFTQEAYTVAYNVDTMTKVVENGGLVWVKMNRHGFGCYDTATGEMKPFYNDPTSPDCQMTNAVVRFDVSEEGVLWLSPHYERGLFKAVPLNLKIETLEVETELANNLSNPVRAIMRDGEGCVWIGAGNGYLLRYDSERKLQRQYSYNGGSFGRIYTLKECSRGYIWIGTRDDGLYRLSPKDGSARHYLADKKSAHSLSDNHIYSIEEDMQGRLWVATYGGGINMLPNAESRIFHNPRNSMLNYPFEECSRVRYLLSYSADCMLAATVEGLLIFNPSEGTEQMSFRLIQRRPSDKTSLGNNDIIHLMKGRDGRVWLSTYGGGLNCIEAFEDGEPRFRNYTSQDGLPNNVCLSSVEDLNGDIWVACENVVARLNLENSLITTYTLYDGMRGAALSEAAAMVSAAGEVAFAGGSSVYIIDPQRVSSAKIDYKLRFTELYMRNQPLAIGNESPLKTSLSEAHEVVFPYNYSNFRVEFASLNYALQDRVNYMYRLEGYHKDWNIVGKVNGASFSNIPYGRYRLHVKAFVNSVTAADEGIAMDIVIRPPLWLTWWAKLLALMVLATIAWVVWRIVRTAMTIRHEADIEQNLTDMKLQFFTNISHELRTPLTLILGGIEDVQKNDNLSPRGQININLAQKNARRMLSLVNQLLDFRKIVKNKMELNISCVDLIPIVEDALDDFREMASERHIELLFTVSRRSILVWVDIERMESVVYNLLSNAIKFTRDGGRIEVAVTLSEEDNRVYIKVKDNGIGIPKDRINTIFERFVQGSRAVDNNIKGSGIGLSLCRDIVSLHHGEITVVSRQGEGSIFTVSLRLGNSHFGMEQLANSEGGDASRAAYMVSDYTSSDLMRRTDVSPDENAPKILVVEDNRELRMFLYNSMIDSYRVIEAEDGVDALAKIRDEEPDIVVTDLMMPNMDGIELINHIRHDFTMSHLPVIMLTAKHSPDDRIKAMEYGADGYITKPFGIELLLARIENLLTLRSKLAEKFAAQTSAQPTEMRHVIDFGAEDIVVTDRDGEFLKSAMNWIGENIENSELTIDQLATYLGMGRTTMYNKLKSLTGRSPVELIKEYRINKAKALLATGQFAVSEVAYKVGFSDPGYFSRCFREQNGMSPAEFIKSLNREKQINQ